MPKSNREPSSNFQVKIKIKIISLLPYGFSHLAVSVDALYENILLCKNNKIAPLHPCKKQLALHLPVVAVSLL